MIKFTIVVVLCLSLIGCRQDSLLQGLEQGQANEVVAVLHRGNIAVDKKNNGKNGYSISVDKRDFAAAVDILKSYDLPSRKPLQIADMFPSDSLVASPWAEKARLFSGIEQRLEQSLYIINGVVSARVHVSYDLDAGDGGRKVRPVHISALANYEGDIDAAALINDIKRFLKNSFSEMEYENISVVLSKRTVLQHQIPKKLHGADGGKQVGVVAAVLFAIGVLAWLWFRYNKKIQAWRERRFDEQGV